MCSFFLGLNIKLFEVEKDLPIQKYNAMKLGSSWFIQISFEQDKSTQTS